MRKLLLLTLLVVLVTGSMYAQYGNQYGNVRLTYLGEYQTDTTATSVISPFYVGDALKWCLVIESQGITTLDSIFYYHSTEKTGTANVVTPLTTATSSLEGLIAGQVTATTVENNYEARGLWLHPRITYATDGEVAGKIKVWAKCWLPTEGTLKQKVVYIGSLPNVKNTTKLYPAFYVGDADSMKVFVYSTGATVIDSLWVRNSISKSTTPLLNRVNASLMIAGTSGSTLTAGTGIANLISVNFTGAGGGIPAFAWQWAVLVYKNDNSGTPVGELRAYAVVYSH